VWVEVDPMAQPVLVARPILPVLVAGAVWCPQLHGNCPKSRPLVVPLVVMAATLHPAPVSVVARRHVTLLTASMA
jgi:hypothetical protein